MVPVAVPAGSCAKEEDGTSMASDSPRRTAKKEA